MHCKSGPPSNSSPLLARAAAAAAAAAAATAALSPASSEWRTDGVILTTYQENLEIG